MAQESLPQVSADLQNGGSEQSNGNSKSVTFSCIKVPLSIQSSKGSEAIQFYKSAFGAVEVNRENHPKRKADQELPLILAADLQLGSSVFTISETADDSSPLVPFTLSLVTEDVDGAVANAVKAGGKLEGEIVESDSGCVGKVKDPYGYVWAIESAVKKEAEVVAA